jgi:hypothetical protein
VTDRPPGLCPATGPTRSWLRSLQVVLALALLNFALTFDNLWPTPAIVPSAAVSLEFLALLAILLGSAKLAPAARARVVSLAALLYTLLAFGRYAEVTIPALFGRPINLYWDGRHIPGLLALAWQQTPVWQSAAIVAAALALVVAVHRLLRCAVRRVADSLAGASPLARAGAGSAAALAGFASLVMVLVAPVGDLPAGAQARLRDYVVHPVSATWLTQGYFVATALSAAGIERRLPPSPAFAGNVAGLQGADLILVFLESYGAAAFDNPGYSRQLQPRRDALAAALAHGGRHAVSAFVRSPTFGGGSWLAHASLLSGIDVSDPGHYDLLLTTRRPTLVSHFRSHGYGTVALMPGIRADWPEGSFYGYDALLDSRSLDYRGPGFGYWRIPDQFSIARFAQQRRDIVDPQPQFLVFPTVTSHIPFGPVPPYQPDWSRMTATAPFASSALSQSLGQQPDWLDLGPAYVQTLSYSLDWITGYVALPPSREYMMILIGDHQPAASVSGRDASWDVPVHLITSDAGLAERFTAFGFTPGLVPRRPTLGAMSELTKILLQVLNLP